MPRPSSPDEIPLDPEGAERVYRILCRMAHADGDLDPGERVVLERYRVRLELGSARAAALEREAIAGARLAIGPGTLERSLMLAGVLDVLAADGAVEEREEHQLFELGRALELPRELIEDAIRRRCAALIEAEGDGPSANGVRRIYMALARLASCDGTVAPVERARLESFRIRHGIGADEALALEAQAAREDDLRVGKHPAERWMLMDELVALAAADGTLAIDENVRVLAFARAIGLEPDEVRRRLELAATAQRAGAPPPAPPPLTARGPLFRERIEVLERRLSEVDREHGPYHERHRPILLELGAMQELSGELPLAIALQERLVETGVRLVVEAGELARDWQRLARLYRTAGRVRDAERAEEKARALRGRC